MIIKKFESMRDKKLNWPTKSGWYWVLLDGYDSPTPCWYKHDPYDADDERCFLPGGM